MIRIAKFLGLLVWATALVLGAPATAHADPISAAIITTLGFTATASAVTAVTSFLINAAFAVGASLVSKLTRKSTLQERQASVTTLSLGEVPREAVLGEVCTAGSLIDIFNHGGQYGTDNVTRCVALADHMLTSIVGYYVDDAYYAWSGGGVQAGFSGCLTIDFVNASMNGAAPPARITAIPSAGWGATDTLAGVSHVWITTKFDEKVWTQGHPTLKFVVRGLPVYDPRKDAALGYVGANPHVWSNPATHEFSKNAALLRYAYVRGIYAVGRQGQAEHLLIGRGLTAEEAPPARIIAAANLCDELVAGAPRYTAAGVIAADEAFIEVEEKFAAAMAGVIVQREGGVEVEPGQAKAVVATITDADLVVGAPVSFSAFMPDTEQGRINTVVPRYIEPAQAWKDHAGPVRRSLTDIAADNGPREITLSLDLVTRGVQADWCAEVTRLLSRLERRGTIVLPPRFGHLEEGDWIAWQSDRRHAGATVRYRIESWALNEGWRNQLVLREIASSVYGVADPLPDTSAPPPAPPVVDALQLLGVSAEAITLPGETAVLPAVRFHWDTPVDAAVRAIRAEVRRSGETEAAPTRTEDVNAGVLVATNGVGPDQALQVRLVPIGDPTRPVLPSNWITVTTGTLIAGGVGEHSAAELAELFGQMAAIGDGAVADAYETWNAAREASAAALFRNSRETHDLQKRAIEYIDGKRLGPYVQQGFATLTDGQYQLATMLSLIGVRSEDGEAFILRSDTVQLSNGEALVDALVRMEAATDDAFALAQDEINLVAGVADASARSLSLLGVQTSGGTGFRLNETTVQVGARGALGDVIDALTVTVGEDSASVMDLIHLVLDEDGGVIERIGLLELDIDGPEGINARITALQSIVGDGDGVEAIWGMVLDVNGYVSGIRQTNTGTSSDLIILADAFRIVTPGEEPKVPFEVVGDRIRMTGDVEIDGSFNLMPGSVTNTQIAPNSATRYFDTAGTLGADLTLGGGAKTVASVTVADAVAGKRILIEPDFYMVLWHPAGGDFSTVTMKLTRFWGGEGEEADVWTFTPQLINGDLLSGWFSPKIYDVPPIAGDTAYTFSISCSTPTGDFAVAKAQKRFMSATQFLL